jgi:hypothetical protein
MSRVVHCKREPYDLYIGRGPGSVFGNPWVIGPDGSREEVIDRYETWLRTGRGFGHPEATETRRRVILASLPELRGKTLGCWCAPQRCHGEVLLALLGEADALQESSADQPKHGV